MQRLLVIALAFIVSCCVSAEETQVNPDSLGKLLNKVQQENAQEQDINRQREQAFLAARNEQRAKLNTAEVELSALKNQTRKLRSEFDNNEVALNKQSDMLRLKLGNLGEMFGVVRQVSQDVISLKQASIIATSAAETELLERLATSKTLPNIHDLEGLWLSMQTHMTAQGDVNNETREVITEDGNSTQTSVYKVGPFVAFNDTGYLQFDSESNSFIALSRQPGEVGLLDDYIDEKAVFAPLAIDPTRGAMLGLYTQTPSLMERIKQGGFIGYCIMLLTLLGVSFALLRVVQLQRINQSVRQQMSSSDISRDNPLGRVLSVYRADQQLDTDSLEKKIDEAVLAELPALEKGQSLIKLLAAVAPLMGLLGTVVGMIATFQSITLFGTGDPKLMAAGISQALITTVQGLVAAIPLLFMHNLVSTRSRSLIQILDKQAAGMLAQRAESTHP
jgi:biopolymer transport protein ExbB